MSRLALLGLLLALLVAAPGRGDAQVTGLACQLAKQKAIGKTGVCLATQSANALRGDFADLDKCANALDASFLRAEANANKLGDICVTFGDAGVVFGKLTDLNDRLVDHVVLNTLHETPDTVIDTATGLEWLKATDPPDGQCDLMNVTLDPVCLRWWNYGFTWPQVAEVLSIVQGAGGHSDWRLPTIAELQTIDSFTGRHSYSQVHASTPLDVFGKVAASPNEGQPDTHDWSTSIKRTTFGPGNFPSDRVWVRNRLIGSPGPTFYNDLETKGDINGLRLVRGPN